MRTKPLWIFCIALLILTVLSVPDLNVARVSAAKYPALYVEPAVIVNETLTPGEIFAVAVKTDYNGSDITGWRLDVSFNASVLNGVNVTNGDIITTDVDPMVIFVPGEFDNVGGEMSKPASAIFFSMTPPPPTTSGPGTLAYVYFEVVGSGGSPITIELDTFLVGWDFVAEDKYHIVDALSMPDNIGHGVFANVPLGLIGGKVTDASTGKAIAGATVTAVGPQTYSTTTGTDGTYLLADIPPVDYAVDVSKPGYYSNSTSVTVRSGETTTANFTLQLITGWIKGTVTDASTGNPIVGANVTAGNYLAATEADGSYLIADVPPGDYTVEASKSGYISNSTFVTVVAEQTTTVNLTLRVQESPSDFSWYPYLAAAGVAAIIIVAATYYILKTRRRGKPEST